MTKTTGSILLVDDEAKIRDALAKALREEGHEVVAIGSPREAQRLLSRGSFDVLLVDNLMPELTGLDLIRELVATSAAGRSPADPPDDRARHRRERDRGDEARRARLPPEAVRDRRAPGRGQPRPRSPAPPTQHGYLLSERDEEFNQYGIVGRSRRVQDVIKTAQMVAKSKSTVLITGETGTGKEMVARAIHFHSAQREMPLVKVNCAAIPENLLESELFGHVRGAFTGALTNKKGKFALADGGTIFLDEIGTMAPALQSKLLRVLQEREFEPLGSERSHKVDVRVIAATNRDIRQMVSDGRFQEDLYYRLNVIPIHIPPLRERRDDIPLLVDHFVRKHAQRAGKRIDGIEAGVLDALQAADWPGNVRELENTVERAVVLSPGAMIGADVVRLLGVPSATDRGTALELAAAEPRLGRARDRPPRARSVERRQERRRRGHGHQPARPQLLPRQAPHRIGPRPFRIP